MPLVYEDYASKVIPREKLQLLLDADGVEKHLIEIAKDLDDLDELTSALELKHRELQDIQKDFPASSKRQR